MWEDTKLAYKRGADEYTTLNNMDKVFKQQIINTITDPIFLKPLENHICGYSRVTSRSMVQFLFDAYNNITPLQFDANHKMTKEQWDPSTPIIYMFSNIQDGVYKIGAGNALYNVNQVPAMAFNHVFCTGTTQSAHERWTSMLQMNNMWANFQGMFIQAHETYESITVQS
jgi:hypothetical protein